MEMWQIPMQCTNIVYEVEEGEYHSGFLLKTLFWSALGNDSKVLMYVVYYAEQSVGEKIKDSC